MYSINKDEKIGDDIILKDREELKLCLKEDVMVSEHLRQNQITERSLKFKVGTDN